MLVDVEPSAQATTSASSAAVPEPAPVLNGHAPYSEAPISENSPPPTSSKPAAFPTSPVDIAMRKASQSLAVNPLNRKTEVIEGRPKANAPAPPPEAEDKEADIVSSETPATAVRGREQVLYIHANVMLASAERRESSSLSTGCDSCQCTLA